MSFVQKVYPGRERGFWSTKHPTYSAEISAPDGILADADDDDEPAWVLNDELGEVEDEVIREVALTLELATGEEVEDEAIDIDDVLAERSDVDEEEPEVARELDVVLVEVDNEELDREDDVDKLDDELLDAEEEGTAELPVTTKTFILQLPPHN